VSSRAATKLQIPKANTTTVDLDVTDRNDF